MDPQRRILPVRTSIAVLVLIFLTSHASKLVTAHLMESGASQIVADAGEPVAMMLPPIPHSRRFYSDGNTARGFACSSGMSLGPVPDIGGGTERIPLSPLKNPIYWECSPGRYPLGVAVVLVSCVLMWFSRASKPVEFRVRSLLIGLIWCSAMATLWLGLVYPTTRLFWTGVQNTLKHRYISDLNEIDSRMLLWMAPVIHHILYFGVLLGVLYCTFVLLSMPSNHPSEAGPDARKRTSSLVGHAGVILLILYCLSAPLSTALTFGTLMK